MLTRKLGRSNVQISAMGMGCWAIGGPFTNEFGKPVGWGDVNDDDSIRAIHRALDLGITFFDTADVYGCGHSERILAQALAGKRAEVVIATKFGRVFDEQTRLIKGNDASPEHIRRACEASLRRLSTDHIDLYQFHLGSYDPALAAEVRDTLEMLVAEGKIRWYDWSTDDPDRARIFAQGAHCAAVQHRLNLFEDNARMIELCDEFDLASINRSPLAMGLLTGKFSAESQLSQDDVRREWNLREGKLAQNLGRLKTLRAVLTQDGRTLAQAALGWLWTRSERTIPIPGFKTVQQVEENAGALHFGPLSDEQMKQVNDLLAG
jgi:aryl-alcohol dehydrogenase-like predicted oxidoreductase